ncbi:c-type cytochrome [Hymenobacter arizonensis]|uniref:Cytochrome C oxidase, cbb3-type, subunit III n=1 Tax=Hymenobacter arizonensis TaxID=1227077 RepID=A0A1I6BDK3_HYMAR|nr:c-type cytochrome [Hymenobacter arizonensis]SFQ78981.1 Cytochrome C oxidase, cbb3-type, subunit III [Hymenobacter arizonensis]
MKTSLCLLGVALLLAAGAALAVALRGIPHYAVPAVAARPAPAATPAQLALGGQLVRANCAVCHRNPRTDRLSGAPLVDVFPGLGRLYAPNITQDRRHGIGAWTDAELAAVVRTGIGRDGRFRVIMPHAVHLSDADLQALLAFLRSADPLVQADATPTPAQAPSFLLKILTNTVMKPSPLLPGPRPTPAPAPALAYGRYLVTGRYACFECHSRSHETNQALRPEQSAGYLGGGTAFHDRQGRRVHSANLTGDPDTGLGRWTPAQLAATLRFGQSPHGPTRHPMPVYSAITDEEVRGIYAYLQSVPRLKTTVPK